MKITVSGKSIGVVAYPAFAGEKKSPALVSAALSKAQKAGVFRGEAMEASYFNDGKDAFLFIGLGKKEDFCEDDIRKSAGAVVRWAKSKKMGEISFAPNPGACPEPRQAALAAEGAILADFKVDYKTTDKKEKGPADMSFAILAGKGADAAVRNAVVIAEAQNYARKLINIPPNIATPEYIMAEARKLAKERKLEIKVFDRAALKKMGANGILAVNSGSPHQAYIVHLVYKGGKRKVALVGKGITFDSGGINTKPPESMQDMHMDKSGACVVLGILKAASELNLPFELHGVIGLTENMPDGAAYKMNDILKMMSGKTVEIYHTDAEGRVILGDCLFYACEKIKPECLIDYATLTGAMSVALGRFASGIFSNDDGISETMSKAGFETNERVWRMPMWKEYADLIKGTAADIRNTSTARGEAGSITGAKFLEAFVSKGVKWVHVDIASTDVAKGHQYLAEGNGAGPGVRLTLSALRMMAKGK